MRLEKIPVGGIKLSAELAQFDMQWQTEKNALVPLLRSMTDNKINLVYLSIFSKRLPAKASFCVASQEASIVKKLIARDLDLRAGMTIRAPISALTVFPHRSSLRLLGRLLSTLRNAGCPVYGVASSISTLTFNTDYGRVEHALKALESILDLPPNHTPYRQEFLVKQI